ncbi:MAG: Flp pilus assembly complex ATPase component TadA [Proteobacteria bacterium]|nr:Flp pilus assembly complex ATPase component TadA [Pseudomonadota bacterium]
MADTHNLPVTGATPGTAVTSKTLGSATRTPGKVIAFSGPKEGVGKTTVALNLALAWAGSQSRNVIIVHLDPLCRQEIGYLLGIQNPPSLAQLSQTVGKDAAVLSKLLKGRIPISNWGVGVLPLGNKRTDTLKLSPEVIVSVLSALTESYDLFLDVDPFFPMQVFAFDLADMIYWTTLPQRAHFEATYNHFQELKALHFPLERFEVVINQANLPGALAPKEVEKFFGAMNKHVLAYMPWDDLLPEFANVGRILVVEHPQSEWVKSLRSLLGRLMDLKPTIKNWTGTSFDQGEFNQGADMLWKPRDVGSPEGSGGVVKFGGNGGAIDSSVPPFWDDLMKKTHGNVVKAMETEHIRVDDTGKADKGMHDRIGAIIENFLQKESNLPLTRDQRAKFVQELIDEILGLGPLEQLNRDPSINEIMVNAPDKVYIERAGKLILTPLRFRNEEQIIHVIKRIVSPIGRRVDESVPLVDARLKDGSRVNAIIPPLAVSGPTLTIRRFSQKPFTYQDLIKKGSITPEIVDFLKATVLVRKNIIISGGTGTGKTTFLNMLSGFIPEDERIVTVEDTAELRLQQDHWVRLESRPKNIEGKGEVTIRDLVKNCLRMRPDRIVVGECRGAEALDMLQAMNTGHEGSLTTIHANSPRDAISRCSAMCLMAEAGLPMFVLREMIASAVHLIVQITRFSDGTRKCTYVTELTGRDENTVLSQDIFRYTQTGVNEDGKVEGYFSGCGNPPKFYEEFKQKGIPMPLSTFWTPEQRKRGGV